MVHKNMHSQCIGYIIVDLGDFAREKIDKISDKAGVLIFRILFELKMEVPTGIEPVYAVLQTAA